MDWLLFLLLPGVLVLCQSPVEDPTGEHTICTSCDEFIGKTCRKNVGTCHPRHPDFACQTKEVYTQLYTGEYLYKYSILGCPKRCVEYTRITKWEKNVFFCCKENYCNSLSVKGTVAYNHLLEEIFA